MAQQQERCDEEDFIRHLLLTNETADQKRCRECKKPQAPSPVPLSHDVQQLSGDEVVSQMMFDKSSDANNWPFYMDNVQADMDQMRRQSQQLHALAQHRSQLHRKQIRLDYSRVLRPWHVTPWWTDMCWAEEARQCNINDQHVVGRDLPGKYDDLLCSKPRQLMLKDLRDQYVNRRYMRTDTYKLVQAKKYRDLVDSAGIGFGNRQTYDKPTTEYTAKYIDYRKRNLQTQCGTSKREKAVEEAKRFSRGIFSKHCHPQDVMLVRARQGKCAAVDGPPVPGVRRTGARRGQSCADSPVKRLGLESGKLQRMQALRARVPTIGDLLNYRTIHSL